MNIDRGSFLMLVSTLAIGGASGYVVAEKRLLPAVDKWRGRPPEASPEPVHAAPVVDAAAPAIVAVPPPPPPAPVCDDTIGSAGECPPPGFPTVEGGCGSFANVRCGELKQALKPRVAQTAVACLNKLTPHERCDPSRVTLCGHLALTNACLEPEVSSVSAAGSVAAPPSPAAAAPASAVPGSAPAATATASPRSAAAVCQGIVAGCGASPIAPSMNECRQLLSGMNDVGRDRTAACMKSHCFDRGLVGCEAVVNAR